MEDEFTRSIPFCLLSLYLGLKIRLKGAEAEARTVREIVSSLDPLTQPRQFASTVLINLMAAELIMAGMALAAIRASGFGLHAVGVAVVGSHPVGAAVMATTMSWMVLLLWGVWLNALHAWRTERSIKNGVESEVQARRSVPRDVWFRRTVVVAAGVGCFAAVTQAHVVETGLAVLAGVVVAIANAAVLSWAVHLLRARLLTASAIP